MSVPETAPDAPAATGRYCLAVCYCRQCPHWAPFVLTPPQRAALLHTLSHPSRKYTPPWYRDPLGKVRG